MKTIAAVLYKINDPLHVKELIIPELKHGQVLVRVSYSGICRSQLNEIDGLKGEDKFLPHTLGHEGSGIVEAIGKGVKKVQEGDRVVLTWLKGNGADIPSCQYLDCGGSIVNSGAISTFLAKAVVSENRVIKIPERMPLKEAALLGCAIPTGAGIVVKTAKKRDIGSIAIFGLGGIGSSALLAAQMIGIKTIIGVDMFDYKLEKAQRLGATYILDSRKDSIVSCIAKITAGRGVDCAIECSGSRDMMEAAFQSVCDKKGLCVIAGNLPKGDKISLDPFELIKGKEVMGTWGGGTEPDADIPMYAELYMSGKLKIDRIMGDVYNLHDMNKALNKLREGSEGRILIGMDLV